jgi:hypothetical protein
MAENKQYNLPYNDTRGLNDRQKQEIQEIIAAALSNWTGVTRFRTIQSTITTITDFTDSQHNHQNAAGGGQLTTSAISGQIAVPQGGTGVNTIATGGVMIGQGAGAITTVVGLSGTGTFYAAASSGASPTVRFDYSNGIITART